MGLTTFSGEMPALKDIGVAKNYLDENELKILNNLASGYFDFAEIGAIGHKPMYMSDYVKQLDTILSSGGRHLLQGAGTISHTRALEKAKAEYRKYQEKTIAPVEEAYMDTIKCLEKEAKSQTRKNRQTVEKNLIRKPCQFYFGRCTSQQNRLSHFFYVVDSTAPKIEN